MRTLLRRLGSWLNRRLHIVATDEESKVYDALDREQRIKEGRLP